MTQTRNILGLDVGERRIGVARANMMARIAEPLLTIDRRQFSDILPKLKELFEHYDVEAVVIGLPRGMEGQETAQTALARQFAADVAAATSLPVYLQDEAATSLMAEDELQATGKNYEKGDIDKLAAAIILRDWLAAQPVETTR